ncbi:class I ribonucleotide reductase maintenance protein YfaE [Aliivibrio wodanis]|uniref:class I ribonucleotide reductase maintenance protein YfaE n=1 Tax=Aliivibrio wodanis TaxID=80852 RepID=UPI00406D2F48
MKKIEINSTITINDSSNNSLLETLEDQGIIAESQCRNGDCGSCRCTLVSGEVSYSTFPLAFLAPNEILPCVCKAETSLVIKDLNYQLFNDRKTKNDSK